MNITFYTPMLKLSGGNIVMFKYAQSLACSGHCVTVIAPHTDFIDKIENGIHIKTFKKFPNKYFEHLFFQLIYLNKFLELTPVSDVIIPVFFPLSVHAIFAKMKGRTKKVIALFQDFREMFWFGRYIFFLLKLKTLTQMIDEFIAISTPIAKEIEKYTKRKPIIVKNGIEHEYFYPRNIEKENYILFVGSSSKMKGLKYFIDAFLIIKKEFPNIKAKIVVPQHEKIEIPDIEVINIGSDRNKLGEIYSKALVYVSLSLGDSFGLPPLEAMACGTAVVMTNTTGAKEYAINGENGLVIPIKNAEKAAESIINLLQNDSYRQKLECNGIKTAQKYFWENSTDNINKCLSFGVS